MISDPDVLDLLYLVSIVCFVLALRFLSSPKHARRGNWIGGVGMLVAIATTLLIDGANTSERAMDYRRIPMTINPLRQVSSWTRCAKDRTEWLSRSRGTHPTDRARAGRSS